ncbi:MAG TPA: serine--tRNA ligase [Candidatus Saccharibacteria bacterium]|nr:serine--tRNA ligase [Candidatus Saccharibacteria bacterium]HMT39341.1 serine--tRNA ligase [Candidatus Saccharibacteria bacterium]
MIDIKKLRENSQPYQESAVRRGVEVDIEELLKLDRDRAELIQKSETLRSQLKIDGKPTEEELEALKVKKKEYESISKNLDKITSKYHDILSQVPNLLANDTPDGDENNNREERRWGKTELQFEARDHVELGEINNLFDFEAGAKVSGAKFYFTKDKMLRLWQAIELFAQNIVRKEGFEMMGVPHMVNYDVASGTGYMPRGEENQNYIDSDQKLVLIATSEIPITGYHKDDVLDLAEPKLYAGLSPSYRLEAGAYGKFSKGLYRTHQFEKLEMYVFCHPDQSNNWLQKIVEIEEKICQELNIPYRVVRIAAGDMSTPAYEKYDLEYFSPAEKDYRELTSCSNCTDFQARNLNIRYRTENGKLDYVHTLNGTTVVSSRMTIAILENYQQVDGTVKIPEVLQKYYGAEVL